MRIALEVLKAQWYLFKLTICLLLNYEVSNLKGCSSLPTWKHFFIYLTVKDHSVTI